MNISKLMVLSFFIFMCGVTAFAQNESVQLGSNNRGIRNSTQGGYFDYSDPQAINIKVSVWGFVKFPGKYIVPEYSTVSDLLSFAGGPTEEAQLENLRLMRLKKDSSRTILNINYHDVLMNLSSKEVPKTPKLKPGDVLLVTGEPRYFFKDYLSIGLSVLSAIISVATILVVTLKK